MIRTDIQQLLQPVIVSLGYQLWGCEYLNQGIHSLLRIYIDKEGGIGISDCEIVSRSVSAILDVEDPIHGNYSLEVSSPGIPRPLFEKEHYQEFLGSEVQMKLYQPVNSKRKLTGMIHTVNEASVTIKTGDEEIEIPFSQIVKANLIGE